MAGGEEVEGGVGGDDPESVVLPPEGVQAGPLGRVPHPDGLVLGVGDDQVLPRVEDDAGHVVVVAAASVNFPSLERQGIFQNFVADRLQLILS